VSDPDADAGSDPPAAALLVAGAAGVVLALGLPPAKLALLPLRLAVDVLLAAGLYGVIRWAMAGATRSRADALIPALGLALVTPVVVRVLAPRTSPSLSAPLAATLWFEVSVVAAATACWRALSRRDPAPGRPALAVGAAGLVAPTVIVAAHLAGRPPRPGHAVVVAGVAALAGIAGLAQRRWGPDLPGRLRLLGRWGPSTVAGAQLLDGLVTVLAIGTPLGLVAPRFGEGNPISRAVLEAIGPGFVPLKWGVGLATGLALEASFERSDGDRWRVGARVAGYLLVLRFSLGPGVFSTLQLLL
jgi:hypothetical protein